MDLPRHCPHRGGEGRDPGLLVEILFTNHIYIFGGKWFRQAKGGPIGLRGTCAVARVVMNVWDGMWDSV